MLLKESTDPRILFGKRLANVRKELGWSQEKLAIESGLARSYLSGVERGIRNVALQNICKLAETLGVAPKDLMDINTPSYAKFKLIIWAICILGLEVRQQLLF